MSKQRVSEALIEAILFATPEPVRPHDIAAAFGIETDEVIGLVDALRRGYEERESGLEVRRVGDAFRIYTREHHADAVGHFANRSKVGRLSRPALETLSIVAYRQPVTRGEISRVRGVNVDSVLQTLQERGLVSEVGKDAGPGRAPLYGTTALFLEKIGLSSVSELPPLSSFAPDAQVAADIERALTAAVPDIEDEADLTPEGERLQKVLARAGYGSRRTSEDLIRAGKVRVNGKVAELGARVVPGVDLVEVGGVKVSTDLELVYIALHKPHGVVSTASDPEGRATVMDLIPNEPRVFSIGRLDYDSSGLLLLTNDGELANRVAHPRYGVQKTYIAEVVGGMNRNVGRRLMKGVTLDDGLAKAEDARIQAASKGRAIIEVTVREGRNRVVRRMFEAVGLEVTNLVRTSIGEVRLGRLKEGGWRNLRPDEVRSLMEASEPSGVPGSDAGDD